VSGKQFESSIRATPSVNSLGGYSQPGPRGIHIGPVSAHVRVDISATSRAAFVFSVDFEGTPFLEMHNHAEL
jgi:hypothetical protein